MSVNKIRHIMPGTHVTIHAERDGFPYRFVGTIVSADNWAGYAPNAPDDWYVEIREDHNSLVRYLKQGADKFTRFDIVCDTEQDENPDDYELHPGDSAEYWSKD